MATMTGNFALVRIGAGVTGATTVGEVKEWSIETSIRIVDDGVMGDTWETHLPGRMKWNGKMTMNFDPADTTGQGTLIAGAVITGNWFPDGNATGKRNYKGTATVTGATIMNKLDDVTTYEVTFEGNGALNIATVA